MFPIYFFIFFILLLLLAPFLLFYLFFYFTTTGLGELGFSLGGALFILFLMLLGSFFNIPLSKKREVTVLEPHFFGLFKKRVGGISINLGGAIIPLFIAGYFFPLVPFRAVLITTLAVTFVSYLFSRFVPGKGIMIPAMIPVLVASIFSLVLAYDMAPMVAFISGVLGVLLGGDLLNLPFIAKKRALSIGGGGVFDGIFLVGVGSAFLSGILL